MCLLRPAWRRGLVHRLGLGWPERRGGPLLWAHAASVGEIEALAPLVERWRSSNPRGEVLLTALTATGCEHARRLVPGAAVRTFPLDAPWIAPRVVRRVAPDLFLFSENEIWPNTLLALERAGVPAIQVSGRLSPRAARTLARFPRFAREVLSLVRGFCVQDDEHRARLVALGVKPERVVVTGSLKGDGREVAAPDFLAVLDETRPVVVAGSTHPGEEEAVIGALHALHDAGHRPLCILAPRHPERFPAVRALLARSRLAVERRSALPEDPAEARERLARADVLLLDSMGELAGCYCVATVAFVGGTLVPVGGHNLLEPARCGVPIVVGPHLDSVRRLAERLAAAGAAVVLPDATQLATALATFLSPQERAAASAAARRVALEESGTLGATWQAIGELLGASEPASAGVVAG